MSVSSLAEIFIRQGLAQDTAGNLPLSLTSSDAIWWIEHGQVDGFLITTDDTGEVNGPRNHHFRCASGEAMFSVGSSARTAKISVLAVGTTGTRVYGLPLKRVKELASNGPLAPQLAGWIDRWVEKLSYPLASARTPFESVALSPDETLELDAGETVQPFEGIVWAQVKEGESRLAGIAELTLQSPSNGVPLCPGIWIETTQRCTIRGDASLTLVSKGSIWAALDSFHDRILQWASVALKRKALDELARIEAKEHFQRSTLHGALAQLAKPLATKDAEPSSLLCGDPLWSACRLVLDAQGIPLPVAPALHRVEGFKERLERLARAVRLRVRRVMLRNDWWARDNGPMLAFMRASQQPVALLPVSASRYLLADPADGTRHALTPEIAQSLLPTAYTFQRPFPDQALSVWEVFRFGLQNTRPDITMILLMSLAGGLIGMALPLAVGLIFDSIIPGAARTQLWFVVLGLFVASIAGVIFEVTRGIALLRVEARSDTAIQSAIWDRLLALPLPFFRRFTAGDLSLRANGINAIRQILSGAVITSVLSGFFSVFNFALLFYFNATLAIVATGLVLANLGVTLLVSVNTLRLQRPLYEAEGKISGLVLQLITGIPKLRVAGAELQAYAVWGKAFAHQKKTDLQLAKLGNRFTVFNEAYPLLSSMCLFWVIAFWQQPGLSTGTFLAFTAAFMTFLYATLEAGDALLSILETVPIYERAQPILRALPEVNGNKSEPGELSGRIELSQVSFRYQADGPVILKEISMQVEPGEFVAIVGPSGSGKSTLVRLLLGFEMPETGTIRYDGLDLSGLDVQAVRRQIGVVLQNGKLMPGDIYENIVGSALFTLDEAWEAASKAGLAEDIQQMPMGMHTVLSEGGGTLSGGQRQRLMIARAIVGRPRLILFDEATSALDNRTQAIVNESLAQLQATRIVIAHRLSTITNADRIFVLQKGRIVQSGTYTDLIQQPGAFAELSRRQLL